MEATGEVENLLEKIRPPRLEDAGLEDCALPPDSIKEAFLKAASAVGSRAASIFAVSDDEEDGGCVNDRWTDSVDSSDAQVGIREGVGPLPGPCVAEKGGVVPQVMVDEVDAGVTDAEEKADKVVVVGPAVAEGKDCVDGLRGLKIGGGGRKHDEENEEEREGERPILAEANV
ncbi:UPF0210 protein like [Actinidia chinensis var. chinensis]|uniref:UPF0210 protein like n=1 Tax=Actinidia chinensis var. chinensis TaxID=1590841 RepID=A0A2R6PSV4_ACTCC|nr:UPF0210 protein like [Actinidia chinensis var. chinensis]